MHGDATADPVRAEFQALCEAQAADEYFGDGDIPDLRRRIERPNQSLEVQVGLRGRLGRELRRLGQLDAAIDVFDEALMLGGDTVFEGLRLEVTRDLAIAHLLLAEDENCVAQHGPLACTLPIAPEAIHTRPTHIRRAGDLLRTYLDHRPDNLEARWLLNLARMIEGNFPGDIPRTQRLDDQALASEASFERWPDRASQLGVDAFDLAGGALIDDFDGDGLLDLVTSTWDPCDHPKAFRNDGKGGFENVTAAWGLDRQMGGLNLIHGDYDNDGRPDILILRGAWRGTNGAIRNSLLHNEIAVVGAKGFVDVTRAVGMNTARPTQTAAWADFDGDGDLDLYVGNETSQQGTFPNELWRNDGAAASGATANGAADDGAADDGNWRFTDVAQAAGVENLRFAKGVTWGDYDDDGDPDLYVSNMGPNRLYRNDGATDDATDGGGWRFTDVAPEAGVTEPNGASFATWFFDVENDGDLDLFVADYGSDYDRVFASYLDVPSHGGQPRLYRNNGGTFTEVSLDVGLERPLLPMGANHGDLDNDGFSDIYLGTGVPNPEAVMPNVMYRNDGGQRFVDISAAGGFAHIQKGHGVAFGDLDNDGDLDLFEQMGGAYPVDAFFNALYENPGDGTDHGQHWITLRLEGRTANRFGVGARIEVRVQEADTKVVSGGTIRSIHRLVGTGGSFGGSSLQQEIGLGKRGSIAEIVVRWPGSGTEQVFHRVQSDRIYRIVEGEDDLVEIKVPRLRLGSSGTSAAGPESHHAGHDPASTPKTIRTQPATSLPRIRTEPRPTLTTAPRPTPPLSTEDSNTLRRKLGSIRQRVEAEPRALGPRRDEIAVLLESKQYDLAHRAATAAMHDLPRSPDPAYLRGVIGLARGALGDAEMDFRRALTIEPRHVPALNNLAVVVATRGAVNEAIEILGRVLEVAPADAMALGNLAKLREGNR